MQESPSEKHLMDLVNKAGFKLLAAPSVSTSLQDPLYSNFPPTDLSPLWPVFWTNEFYYSFPPSPFNVQEKYNQLISLSTYDPVRGQGSTCTGITGKVMSYTFSGIPGSVYYSGNYSKTFHDYDKNDPNLRTDKACKNLSNMPSIANSILGVVVQVATLEDKNNRKADKKLYVLEE